MTIKQVTVWMCDYCGGLYHVKGMAEDCHPQGWPGAEGVCKKCAEEVCGCSTMNAEEPAVQEPDWIPDGDGRAIGQQNFGINLSPLHAESFNAEKDEHGFRVCQECSRKLNDDEVVPFKSITLCKQCIVSLPSSWITHNKWDRTRNAESFNAEGENRGDWPKEAKKEVTKEERDEYDEYRIGPVVKVDGRWTWCNKDSGLHGHVGDTTKGNAYCGVCGNSFNAETTGSPSPTFNEDITGQDGPETEPTNSNFSAESCEKCGEPMSEHIPFGSRWGVKINGCPRDIITEVKGAENPTNQTFEAMRTLAPSTRDVDSARRSLKNSGYGDVIYDRYIVNQQGSSNKFYYTAITEKDGKYFPMGAYGRIGYLGTLFNVAGKKERPYASFGSMELAYRQIKEKEDSKINARKSEKRYVDYTLTRGAESLSEIEGPTAEATTGGLHSPSSFAMTWEDGSGQSSASIPPNEIAWAETSGIPLWVKVGAGIALVLVGKKLVSSRSSNDQKAENNLKSVVKARKGCCGGSKIVRKDSEFSVGQINPIEVEGQSDVYGAEELHSPQTSAKVSQPNWGPQTTYLQNQRSTQKMW